MKPNFFSQIKYKFKNLILDLYYAKTTDNYDTVVNCHTIHRHVIDSVKPKVNGSW